MPQITPDQNPDIPQVLETGFVPGERIRASHFLGTFKSVLNGLWYLMQNKLGKGEAAADSVKLGGRPAADYALVSGLPDGETAATILAKLKTVDGQGSGLDADLLDGLSSEAFLRAGVAINADTLDGYDSSAFLRYGKSLNADTLDGYDSSAFVLKSDAPPPSTNTSYQISASYSIPSNQPINGGSGYLMLDLPNANPNAQLRLTSFNLSVSNLQTNMQTSVCEVHVMSQNQVPPVNSNSTDLTVAEYATGNNSGGTYYYGKGGLSIPMTNPIKIYIWSAGAAGSALTGGTFNFFCTVEVVG